MKFVLVLPYAERIEAFRLIDRGADFTLLSFWLNLKNGGPHILFTMEQVDKMVIYHATRMPDFTEDIERWFRKYQEFVGRTVKNTY